MNRQIFTAIYYLFEILKYAIIANAVISFLPISKDSLFVRLLYQITEPILTPIRRMMERSALGRNMMFDISPIIALFLLEVVKQVAARILY